MAEERMDSDPEMEKRITESIGEELRSPYWQARAAEEIMQQNPGLTKEQAIQFAWQWAQGPFPHPHSYEEDDSIEVPACSRCGRLANDDIHRHAPSGAPPATGQGGAQGNGNGTPGEAESE